MKTSTAATEPFISQKNFTLVTLPEKKTAAADGPQSALRRPRPRKGHATGLKEAVSDKKKFAKKCFFEKLRSHGGSFAAVSMNFCILSSPLGRSRRDLDVPRAKKKVSALHDTKILVAKLQFSEISNFDLNFSMSTLALLLAKIHFLSISQRDLHATLPKIKDILKNSP